MAKRKGAGLFVPIAFAVTGVGMLVAGMTLMERSTGSLPYRPVPGGDVERGRKALKQYNCGSCHKIPGVAGADGTKGQPLSGLVLRTDIVGALPNTPEDLVRWIQDPKSIYPETGMPVLNISKQEALDMVAYLYTLPP